MTITLAQAAVFLVRITKAPQTVQAALKVDNAVIAHYLQMSIDLLESSDLSETRLGTNLAKTLRDVGRAAGMPGLAKEDSRIEIPVEHRRDENTSVNTGLTPAPVFEFDAQTFSAGNATGLQDLFQSQNELDLSYLLDFTRDGDLQNNLNWSTYNSGNAASFADFGFAMGGIGPSVPNSIWNGTLDGLGTVFGYPEDNQGAE